MAKYTLSVIVENHAGVLSRVTGMFSRRGFNIDSLAVGMIENPEFSRITIVVDGDLRDVDQVEKQLGKLIEVKVVNVLQSDITTVRELMLIKVAAPVDKKAEIVQIVEIFRGKVVDVSPDSLTIEATGTHDKLKAFYDMLVPYGIIELARTGPVALQRGANVLSNKKKKQQ